MRNKVLFLLMVCTAIGFTTKKEEPSGGPKNRKLISVQEYKDAVYASWIGQVVGNTYGLNYEFKFIDNPGPDKFPYGYDWTLDSLKKYNGSYSDDDTDIEYMYLLQMEKYGIEPNYGQLAEAWKKHVKIKVWCANRVALTLMHAGHYPPVTGSKEYNAQWCQIDPQLTNEIWAVTAPGMLDYAVRKSEFSARITSDSFGLEPTLHYAAMYSAAFFENDINKLIDIGTAALPEGARFAKMVKHIQQIHRDNPTDWKAARKIVKDSYYVNADYNKNAWAVIDADMNGALGILALLYGKADFQKTLDFCCAFGMDADNQAATMCGLLGIINGIGAIPKDLMFPIKDSNWTLPFNDVYKMITREAMPDAKLTDMAARMAAQGEKIILANGGEIIEKDGKKYYSINTDAKFTPPFELNPLPVTHVEVDQTFEYPIYTGGQAGSAVLSTSGDLPEGIRLEDRKLQGKPTKEGKYHFKIIAKQARKEKSIDVDFVVHSKNMAVSASKIIFNENAIDKNIELIRDGSNMKTYYSIKKGELREKDFYGYIWDEPQEISSIMYNNGTPQEYCGWFTSFDVEYLHDGKWVRVEKINVYPEMDLTNVQWLKPQMIDYNISFKPLKTKGIRIVGMAGGIPKDPANAYLGLQYYSSISELKIYK